MKLYLQAMNQCAPCAVSCLTGCALDVAIYAIWPGRHVTAGELEHGTEGMDFACDGLAFLSALTRLGWSHSAWRKDRRPPPERGQGLAFVYRQGVYGHWIAYGGGYVYDSMPFYKRCHRRRTVAEYTRALQRDGGGWWGGFLEAWPKREG